MSNSEKIEGFNKSVISWYIPTNVKPLTNPYK